MLFLKGKSPLLVILTLSLWLRSNSFASVTVTVATNGTAISADNASTGGSGAWTTLGPITLTEGTKTDFSPGIGVTLILRAPAGFEFNTSSIPSASFTTGLDILSASAAITDPTNLTVTLTVAANISKDTVVIGASGLQVRPLHPVPLASGRHIYRPSSGGGTAVITGVSTSADGTSGSNFGNLTEVAGALVKLLTLLPGETAAPGTTNGKTGFPLQQSAGVPFSVRINGADVYWNTAKTNDTVHLVSSDPDAVLPANGALSSGVRTVNVTLRAIGSNSTVTASDVPHPAILSNISSTITVVSPLRGGPVVAVHDSELTRALELLPAGTNTPTGPFTSGHEWWPTNWHYFVMPESVQEALRSDGIPFEVVSDADIIAGRLMDTNNHPKYPIVISLASEAVANEEIAPLTNYVAAGGFLLVGSSGFTRTTSGASRGDFAFARELGVHMVVPGVTNWALSQHFTKISESRIVSHIPAGTLLWELPTGADASFWGVYPHPVNPSPASSVWRVQSSGATIIADDDTNPYLLDQSFGNGHFIYDAAMQPLINHGGWSPGMYSYEIFRKAIEWAFEAAKRPLPRISPWPFAYDAALNVRHDLEDYQNEIAAIEASAQVEFTNGVKGDYFFCTGTLRENMVGSYNISNVVAGLQRAVSNYQATIGPHNGGLRNPYDSPPLATNDFDYWHWGPDEALDVTPAGYTSGKAYAMASVSNSFMDIEGWLPGQMTNGMRVWVAPYFDATRENSYDIQSQLGVKITGDQKLSPWPHWTVSTATSGKRYSFLSIPVSDWFVGGTVAQSMEEGQTVATLHAGIDCYYRLGALINFYSHTLSTGLGDAGSLATEYITYSMNTNLHPRLWPVNAVGLYNWWVQRSNAQVSVSYFATNANNAVSAFSISGGRDPNLAIEAIMPALASYSALQVFTNGVLASGNMIRTNGQSIKLRVGTNINTAEFRYDLPPLAVGDSFLVSGTNNLTIPAPGVLTNDASGAGSGALRVLLASSTTNGTLLLNTNGGFTYTPSTNFGGLDAFTYQVTDGFETSSVATVLLSTPIIPSFSDDFSRSTDPGPLAPWLVQAGKWAVTGGELLGGTNAIHTYANVYLTNSWADYAAQVRVRFPAGAFGGAIGVRLDPVTGEHYSAWVYPEGSGGGSNLLRIIKFQDWTSWVPVQSGALPGVGTNWHTIKLAAFHNQLAAYFDGVPVVSAGDTSNPTYPRGGISLDFWTDSFGYQMEADDVLVTVLAADDNYTLDANSTLNVSAPGVLANDSAVFGNPLTATLLEGTAHGLLNFNPDGSFNFTPTANYSGMDSFVYQANDGTNLLGTATVNLTINPPLLTNVPPVFVSVEFADDTTTMTWSSQPGRSYRLQYATDLSAPVWTDIPPDVSADDVTVTASDAVNGDTQRFYRVILLP